MHPNLLFLGQEPRLLWRQRRRYHRPHLSLQRRLCHLRFYFRHSTDLSCMESEHVPELQGHVGANLEYGLRVSLCISQALVATADSDLQC